MAIPTALLAKVLGGLGVLATAATVISVTANRPKDGDTPKEPQPPSPEETLKALNEKIKALGIEGCELGQDESSKTCDLDKEKIEKIKFDGKTGTGLTPESASLNLKIEKGYDTNDFPEGLRFSFTNSSDNDITIGNSGSEIKLLKNTTYDYKIKTSNNTTTLEKAWVLNSINGIAGLERCTANGGGTDITECSFRTGSVNVWRNENDYFIGGGTDPSKKIKVAKDSSGYRGGIKFYVEEEISLIKSDINSKTYILSPNTNYEINIKIAEGTKKWFLVDKTNEDLNKKIKDLGISDCKLENGGTKTSECELDETKVKNINFSNKTDDSTFQVTGLNPDKKLVLVIERDYKDTDFPSGLRFTFTNKNTQEVTIGSSPDTPITLKGNTSYDFKIKTGGSDENKLEKAWTLKSLAEKVGITCTNGDSTECTLKTEGMNVWKSEEDYITEATQSDNNQKITITKDQPNYFEGLKFTVSQDITLTTTANPSKSLQLTQENKSYEISPKDVSGTKKWFLVEKINT